MRDIQKNLIAFLILSTCYFIPATSILAADECKVDCASNCAGDSDCIKKCNDDEEKCEKLNKQAETYEKILKLNDKQQGTLQDQLNYLNREHEITRSDLQKMSADFNELERKIASLERDILEKEKSVKSQRMILSGLMQTYYEYDQQGLLEIVILNQSLAQSLNQSDYISQSGVRASEVLDQIQELENQLISEQDSLKADREKIVKIREELQYKKSNLELSQNQKVSLLEKTQGEEEKYTQLLENIEKQKLELFNFSDASNLGEVIDSVKNYPKPPSKNQASTAWYFSQRDSRWGSQRIGNSKSLMKDYGCAVTAVAMAFKKQGANITPGTLAKQKIFEYDLIRWPGSWSPSIKLASSVGHGNISWSKIDSQIKNGSPVIVYIKKTNGRGGHYVVVTGKDAKDYIVHDPYFGANLYLGTSKALVGKIGTDSKTVTDQMIIYN
jgi:peptidoglycan hydrolase CwlO-like protein